MAAGSRDFAYWTGCHLGIVWRSHDSGPLPPSESWGESEASPMIRVLIVYLMYLCIKSPLRITPIIFEIAFCILK